MRESVSNTAVLYSVFAWTDASSLWYSVSTEIQRLSTANTVTLKHYFKNKQKPTMAFPFFLQTSFFIN